MGRARSHAHPPGVPREDFNLFLLVHTIGIIEEQPSWSKDLKSLGYQVEFDETQPAIYFHDGTERPIPRPVEDDRQRAYYSGKKNNTGSKTMC